MNDLTRAIGLVRRIGVVGDIGDEGEIAAVGVLAAKTVTAAGGRQLPRRTGLASGSRNLLVQGIDAGAVRDIERYADHRRLRAAMQPEHVVICAGTPEIA